MFNGINGKMTMKQNKKKKLIVHSILERRGLKENWSHFWENTNMILISITERLIIWLQHHRGSFRGAEHKKNLAVLLKPDGKLLEMDL